MSELSPPGGSERYGACDDEGAAPCGRPQSLPPTGGKVAFAEQMTDEGADERGITFVGTLISLASLDSFPLPGGSLFAVPAAADPPPFQLIHRILLVISSALHYNKITAGRGARARDFDERENAMTASEKKELMTAACHVRMDIIRAVHAAKSGHPGGSLSAADLFTYLYQRELRVDPANPKWPDRDRFVLSKGHTAPGLYAVLAERGFFPVEELETLRHIGSDLQGHPNMNETPGVDMSTGSLGQGISAACGMALSAKYLGKDCRVYALLGDGEIQEGEVWEAFMFAHHYKLDNLCAVIDNNGLQIDGNIADVMSPYPIPDKLRAFGWAVAEIDGHDFDQMEAAFAQAKATKGVPFAIVMKTVKGKGVSFMENQAGWHGKAPNDQEYETAMAELSARLAEVEAM